MRWVLSIFVLLISMPTAFACTCVNWAGMPLKDREKYLESVPAIFEGEVISLGEKRSVMRKMGNDRYYEEIVQPVRFSVARIWKGFDEAEITVNTDVGSSCRFLPALGVKYTVYAGRIRGEGLSMNMCSVGRFSDDLLKTKYGEGKVIEQKVPPEKGYLPETLIISMIGMTLVNFFI